MKISDAQKVFEVLDKAFSEITHLSEEHPETQGKEVAKVEIRVTVSYEGTSTQITSSPILIL